VSAGLEEIERVADITHYKSAVILLLPVSRNNIAALQVQSNVQTVLEGLGLVENRTAKQDAAALKEVNSCSA